MFALRRSECVHDLQAHRADGGLQPQVFARYERRQPQVNRLLCTAFISGVSTRQVGPLTALLLEEAVSASTVSRVTQALDAEVCRFQTRALPDRYGYLLSFRQVPTESEASCDRIIYAVIRHLNTMWERHPLAQFTQKA